MTHKVIHKIFAVLTLLIIVSALPAAAAPQYAGVSFGETAPAYRETLPALPLAPGAAAAAITGLPESAVVGDGLSATAAVSYSGEPTLCRALWLANNVPVYEHKGFLLCQGQASSLALTVTDAHAEAGGAIIAFVLYAGDTEITRVQQTVTVSKPLTEEERQAREREYILNLVQPVRIEATTSKRTGLYSDVMLTRKISTVNAGLPCQVLSSKSDYSNKVLFPDGTIGWVSTYALDVSTKNYTRAEDISNYDKDLFVRTMGYESTTDYLIWVHLERQKVNVFMKKDGKWSIECVYPCASGTNRTPTINGVFTYSAYQKSWNYASYYVAPVMIFSGNYALHSILLNYDGTVHDGTLGTPASHGCVRMEPAHLRWMADNIPRGTTVVVH